MTNLFLLRSPDNWQTTDQMAKALGVSNRTVRHRAYVGQLERYKTPDGRAYYRQLPAQPTVVPMSLDVKQAVTAALESTEPMQLDTVAIHAKIRRLEVQVEELTALVKSLSQPAPTKQAPVEEQWLPQSQVASELGINSARFLRWEMRGVLTRQDRDGVPHVLRSQVEACLKMKRMPPCSADKQVVACAKVGMSLNEVGELVGQYGDSVRAVLERLGYTLARKFNRETGRSYSYIAALPSSVASSVEVES